jgi:DNA-binding MarR family transcriptional regulator
MKKLFFTPDEQIVIDFLKLQPRSSASEIAAHTELKQRGAVTRVLDSLDAKGVLRHTDDAVERYYLVHTRKTEQREKRKKKDASLSENK